MSAGLPGFGLSGLFFLACALMALPREGVRLVRGRSTRASRRSSVRQFTLAAVIVAVIDLTFRFVFAGDPDGVPEPSAGAPVQDAADGVDLFVLPVEPLLVTAALLVALLLFAKALHLVLAFRARSRRRGGRPVSPGASA